jgi:two-component system sensor histidine kinase VicK
MTDGHLTQRITAKGRDEYAELAQAFNNMSEKLEQVDKTREEFVSNVSHELKTPLTTIKSYTETLKEGSIEHGDTALDFYNIIDSEVDRMTRLVKDLLQLSRLDYKQQKWYKKQEDLVSLVRTAIKKMDMTAKSKELQINHLFDKDMFILVDMDRDRIEQVILNILSNAIKYTDEKGRIDIDIIRGSKDVKIVIADNGVGIPEKQLSRVFERFFRVDKARSRMMGGTGLGLSISKQIIEEHKGSIAIESHLGQGTKLTVTLLLAPIRGKRGIE